MAGVEDVRKEMVRVAGEMARLADEMRAVKGAKKRALWLDRAEELEGAAAIMATWAEEAE